MCGITLKPFRLICKEAGAGLVFNQMVSAKALTMGDQKSFKMLEFDESERPFGLQLFGNDADTLSRAAEIMEERQPDIIDLNVGCPAKKIVGDGGGSALLTDEAKLRDILTKMRRAIKGTFTIKVRAGWDEKSKNAFDVAKMAEDIGVDAIAIHARTRAQGYSGHADWNFIGELKTRVKIPVIGNGDVKIAQDAHRMLKETGCDAVMTGRAAFESPWIFNQFIDENLPHPSMAELKIMILKQYDLFRAYFGETGGIKMMRKFLCAYTKGKRDGSRFRNKLVRLDDWNMIQDEIHTFFVPENEIFDYEDSSDTIQDASDLCDS